MGTQSQFIDIVGQTFNELTAIEYLGYDRMWLWKCSCGKTCTARKNDVTSGRKKSCGHLSNRGGATINVGQQFGEWTVLKDIGNRHFLCRCSCGTERSIHSYDLRKGKSKSCGHVTKGTSANGRIDITGQQIGEWTVGEYLGDGYYNCVCSCGKQKKLKGNYLRTGQSKSCGHATNTFKDLTGQQFGEWKALNYLGNYTWKCQCSCGNIKNVTSYELTHGKSTNCGHKRKEDLTGRRFSRLVPIRYLGNTRWECQCDCGNKTIVNAGNIISGSTKSCGCLKDIKEANILDSILHITDDFIASNGQLPFAEDIADGLDITPTTVRKYADKYNFTEKFNKHFGSRAERDIYNFCKQFENDVISRDRKVIAPQELDIYIPEKKIAIEFNGNYWHSAYKINECYHQNKTIACAKQGIHLIHIFEYEWNKSETRLKLQHLIESKLTTPNTILYARNTIVKTISDEESREFLEKYHLQGYTQARINLGLYYNNELISLLTFGVPRFNNNYEYEIIRYCTKYNCGVIGGLEKLFSHFIKNYNPKSIITYSDISKFTGNVYTRIGFKPIQPKPITKPNYVWYNENNNTILTRYQTQKHKLIELELGTENQTELEIMQNNNYIQLFDCGNIKLEWLKDNDM